jgi:GMP synthase (glutamine-hydrolysing)
MARVLAVLTGDSPRSASMAAGLGARLAEAGCTVDTCRPFAGEAAAPVRAYHGLLIVGAEPAAEALQTQAWADDLRDMIRAAARLGIPTLGVGAGHQVAARVLGGTVAPGPYGRQHGLLRIGWDCEVLLDPLFDRIAGEDRAPHDNAELVTVLPAGGVVLAQTGDGEIQVARLAATVWGVQFLLGVPPDTGRDIDEALARAFARLVRGRAGARGELWE